MHAQPVTLSVQGVWVRRRRLNLRRRRLGRITLADAQLQAAPGQLVAIIGPNGAGKTTLLRAIAGERPQRGEILLNGQSLYQPGGPEHWLPKIGYVPVDSVLHDQLTVRQALSYVARLRLPDLPSREHQQRISTWLSRLGVAAREHQRLATLSSGERKKVTICAELLTDPMLLLLDEPTSNLDPNAEHDLMLRLRDLAEREHKTILIVTHTLSTLHHCHEVAFVADGRVLRQAPLGTLLADLDPAPSRPGEPCFERWARVFAQHPTTDQHQLSLPKPAAPAAPQPAPPPHPAAGWRQFWVLLRRSFALQLNAPLQLIFRLLLGWIGGLFLFVLPADSFVRNRGDNIDISDARTGFFLIGLVIALIGMISSFQEVSREWRIYHHERQKGLSPWAYLSAKWMTLNLLVGVVAPLLLILMLVFIQNQPLQPPSRFAADDSVPRQHGVILAAQMPWFSDLSARLPEELRATAVQLNLEALVSLTLACLAALALGLLLSAASRSDGMATLLLAMAVIFHVFLSGLSNNKQLEWLIDRLSIFASSYWAIRGFSVSGAVYCWSPAQFKDFYSLGHLLSIWLALLAYMQAALLLSYLVLRTRDGWTDWRWSLRQGLGNRAAQTLLVLVIICASWSMFLRARSWDYYALQESEAVVRIDTLPLGPLTPLQRVNGWVSQAQCPQRVKPRPAPTVSVPTPAPGLAGAATAQPTPTRTAPATPGRTSTPVRQASPTPTSPPTVRQASPTPTSPPTVPAGVPALPEGQTNAAAELHFGPQHDSFTSLPAGSRFTLLARDARGQWLRVLWRNPDDNAGYIGWIEAGRTDIDPQKTSEAPVPPRCAPATGLLSSRSALWQNQDDRGAVALVIDVFRAENGSPFPAAALEVLINDRVAKHIPINQTRGSFLLPRYTVSDLQISPSDRILVRLAELPADQPPPELFGVLFFVPSGCSFR